jgi:hypothetical protein
MKQDPTDLEITVTSSRPTDGEQEWDNVNTSGKAGAKIPQLPLGDDSSPWGR